MSFIKKTRSDEIHAIFAHVADIINVEGNPMPIGIFSTIPHTLTDEEIKKMLARSKTITKEYERRIQTPRGHYIEDELIIKNKKCTCDFQKVIMVTGCKCGGE